MPGLLRTSIKHNIDYSVLRNNTNKIKDRMTSSLSFEIDSAREEPWEATNHRAMMANYCGAIPKPESKKGLTSDFFMLPRAILEKPGV